MKQNTINVTNFTNYDLYLIGLISSDGHINHPLDDSSSKGYRCYIGLKYTDADILLELYNYYGGSIRTYNKTTLWNMPCKSKETKIFIDFLVSIGITHNKSLSLNINKWLNTLNYIQQICFLRGYLDGNGWISNTKNTKVVGICSGSPYIINFFCDLFPNAIFRERKTKNSIYTACLHWRYIHDCKDMFDIKILGHFGLKRKYQLYENLKNYFRNTPPHKYKSKFIGVYQHKKSYKFFSRIRTENKIYELGYYNTDIEAAVASDLATIILKTKRQINFPEKIIDYNKFINISINDISSVISKIIK